MMENSQEDIDPHPPGNHPPGNRGIGEKPVPTSQAAQRAGLRGESGFRCDRVKEMLEGRLSI